MRALFLTQRKRLGYGKHLTMSLGGHSNHQLLATGFASEYTRCALLTETYSNPCRDWSGAPQAGCLRT